MSPLTLEEILITITNAQSDLAAQASLASYLKANSLSPALFSLIPAAQDPTSAEEKRDPLDVLTMQDGKHTIGYLYFLSARLATSNAEPVTNEQVMLFVNTFNPILAELAPDRMTTLAKLIWKKAESSNQPNLAVLPLQTILEKYPPSSPQSDGESQLTPIHPIFLQACFAASTPNQALHLLRRPITKIHAQSAPPQDTSSSSRPSTSKAEDSDNQLNYLDHLTYTYLGGILLCMLRLWAEADSYLEMCATAPAHGITLSALQLEAAKKLILVQLIAYGKVRPLPTYAPPGIGRLLKQTPYFSLPKSYPSPPSSFPSQAETKIFNQDNNMGLLNIALEKSVRWRIVEMMGTYEVLSLSEVCIQVGLSGEDGKKKGRQVLLSMIEEGEIRATLEIESGEEVVSFDHTVGPGFGMPSGRDIQTLVEKTQREAKRLAILERELLLSKDFLMKALKPNQSDMYDETEMTMAMAGGGWDDMHL